MSRRTFYVTTPIYYVNDLPHIGHTYTTIVADALARFHRLAGDDVYFLTGTDEHGLKIQRSAAEKGLTPQQLADQVVENYRRLWPALNISNDDFIRTTEARHKRGVAALFAQIRAKNPDAIYKSVYRGWYCTGCESYYTASQLLDGGCPDAGHPGRPVEEIEEASWFFRLSAYEEPLLALYENRPEFVMPETRLNEVRAFVTSGLKDLSISRGRDKVGWGIPFPGDPDQTVYVWFDALTNYISALGFGEAGAAPLYDRLWESGDGRTVLHLVGKDILRFHAVYWPAFLMAAGVPLPPTIYGHGWWLMEAAKMSKSVGNIVRPGPLLEAFGADAVRWFLLREIPLGLDGSFSEAALLERTNADLANNIGNLFSRVTTLVSKLPGGRVPAAAPVADDALGAVADAADAEYRSSFGRHEPSAALRALTQWADALNKFLVRREPWRRGGREKECDGVLAAAADHLARLACRLWPAMPAAAGRLAQAIGLPADPTTWPRDPASSILDTHFPVAGMTVRAGDIVFPRRDRATILGGEPAPAGGAVAAAAAGGPPAKGKVMEEPKAPEGVAIIDFAEFSRIQLRVGKVVACEKHPNADKLLRMDVDLGGGEQRQLVAGIAPTYEPADLVGKLIVVVANLKPARLRGLESKGMLLAAIRPDGTPRLIMPDADVPPGASVS